MDVSTVPNASKSVVCVCVWLLINVVSTPTAKFDASNIKASLLFCNELVFLGRTSVLVVDDNCFIKAESIVCVKSDCFFNKESI